MKYVLQSRRGGLTYYYNKIVTWQNTKVLGNSVIYINTAKKLKLKQIIKLLTNGNHIKFYHHNDWKFSIIPYEGEK